MREIEWDSTSELSGCLRISTVIFRFGDFALDSERYELRRGGAVVAAEPKVLEVLAHLLVHHQRVVTREELLAEIWEGRFVSDAALSRAIREVRRLLGDTAAESRWVKTVYGRGFSFAGEVVAEDRAPAEPQVVDGSRDAEPARPGGSLPASLTPLIGREREVGEVCSLLATTRLLTLTGAAGTGKSRLALAVAARVAERFGDGVVFVSLAEVAEPELLGGALALAAGVTDAGGGSALEAVECHLRDQELLLIIDNFEHLSVAAPAVTDLLRACPRLSAMVTSRFVLQVEGEQEYLVPPLSLPDRDAGPALVEAAPAVAMFLARARAALASFRPDEEELAYVVEICRRLDGLPLAIELAAARVKLFSPRELWQRLAERLDLLSSPSRARADRHRGLERALAWSYELLAEDERVLFRQLSVFAGGFCLEAVEQVCAQPGEARLDLLAALVDKSLVERQPAALQEARFGLLETTRDFARERLREAGEEAAARTAHARWVLILARRGEEQLAGGDQQLWRRRLDTEHGNMMAALDWARSGGELAVGFATAAAMARYWSARGGYREGRGELQALLRHSAAAGIDPRARADVLVAHGMLCHLLCDFPCAEESLEEAQTLLRQLDDRLRLAHVLNNLGWVATLRSRLDRAQSISDEALALHRELADHRGVAVALNNLGWVEFYRGRGSRAEERFQQSLAMRRAAGDERGVVFTLANLALIRLHRGECKGLDDWITEARTLVDRLADPPLDGWVRCVEGALALRRGSLHGGLATLQEAVGNAREDGNMDGLAWVLLFLGEAHEAAGDNESARACYQELLEIWRRVDTPWGVAEGLRRLAGLSRKEGDLGTAGELFRQSRDLSEPFGTSTITEACRKALVKLDS